MPHAHVIERLRFEVDFADETAAWAHGQRVQRFAADQAAAVIAAVFDEVDDRDTVVTLAEVEVDLGVLAADASDETWAESLREALRRLIDIDAGPRPPDAASASGRGARPRAVSDCERLWAWLHSGRLPWQADPTAVGGDAIDILAARVLAEQGEALARALRQAPERRRLLERIALQWPRPLRECLARWLALPAEAMVSAQADATDRQRWLERALAALVQDQPRSPAERASAGEHPEPASVDEHPETASVNQRLEPTSAGEHVEPASIGERREPEPARERVRRTHRAVTGELGWPTDAQALDPFDLAETLAQVLARLAADEPEALADTCRRLALPLAQWRRVVRQLAPAARVALVRAMAPTDTNFVLALPASVVVHACAGAANELAPTIEAWAFLLQHLSERPPGQALVRAAVLDALLRHLAVSESLGIGEMRRALAAALASPTLRRATPLTLRPWLEAAAAADATGGRAGPDGSRADAAEGRASSQRRARLDLQLRQARLAAADPAWQLATQLDGAWLLERLRHWAGDAHWRQTFAAGLTLGQWRDWLASRLAPADVERALARLADAVCATAMPKATGGAPSAAFAAALLERTLRDDAGTGAAARRFDASWRASIAAGPQPPDAADIGVGLRSPARGASGVSTTARPTDTEPATATAWPSPGGIGHSAGLAGDHTGVADMATKASVPGIADAADVASRADAANVAARGQWRDWLASRLAPADVERALARQTDAVPATATPTATGSAPPAAIAAALLERTLRDDAGTGAAARRFDASWRASTAAGPQPPEAADIGVGLRSPARGAPGASTTARTTEPATATASPSPGGIGHASGLARDHTGVADMAAMAGVPGIEDVADVASRADAADVAAAAAAPTHGRAEPGLPESPWAEALAAAVRCLDLLAGTCDAAGLGLDASVVHRAGTRVLAEAVMAGPQGLALARLVEAWFAALPQPGLGLVPPASATPTASPTTAARRRQALAQALALASRSAPPGAGHDAAPTATTQAEATAGAQAQLGRGPAQTAAAAVSVLRVTAAPPHAERARDVLAADTAALQARLAAVLAASPPAPNGAAVAHDAAAVTAVQAAVEVQAIDERSEALYLANAGLVLAGPYLPRLLARLELLAGERFVDGAAVRRAVQVLQVVVDDRRETLEHALVLNKLLCGLPQAMPVAREIALDDAEDRAITGMLEAMIRHWGALGRTSVAGLRQSFLQREGVLTCSDAGWRLLVQPRPYDMLLDRLPWGFRTIKYPWMEQVLHVDWR